MRNPASLPILLLAGITLSACTIGGGGPQGVLPRTDVPPPPSVSGGRNEQASAAAQRANPAVQRRALSVPSRLDPPRPSSSTTVEPVMTGSGMGAGFKF